jgi:hypothetical protein
VPRAIWSGSISFGLVNVPVRMVSAIDEQDLELDLLHDKDGAAAAPADSRPVSAKDGGHGLRARARDRPRHHDRPGAVGFDGQAVAAGP